VHNAIGKTEVVSETIGSGENTLYRRDSLMTAVSRGNFSSSVCDGIRKGQPAIDCDNSA
jgi:hypothetical protein